MNTLYMITFSGRKGHGKNTAADLTEEILNIDRTFGDVRQTAFAGLIRNQVCDMFGVPYKDYDSFKRKQFRSPSGHFVVEGRDLVREIGMLMRSYDKDQFVDYVQKQILLQAHYGLPDGNSAMLVTDVRFDNELCALRDLNGRETQNIEGGLVEIEWVPMYVDHPDLPDQGDGHITEALTLDKLKAESTHPQGVAHLVNNGSKLHLQEQIRTALIRADVSTDNFIQQVKSMFSNVWVK